MNPPTKLRIAITSNSAVNTLVRDFVERGGETGYDPLTPRELEVLS